MDVRDVSGDAQIVAMLRNAEVMHQKAKKRNGQLVYDHPPPEVITSNFLATHMSLNMRGPTNTMIYTTQLPLPYLPSERFLDELQPISIQQMRLGEHHRGTKILLRLLTPANRTNAILGVVEDLAGTAVTLQLYHQAPETIVPSSEVISVGKVLIIKEPFFKCATDGSYSLRVDHPSDVMWLDPFDIRVPDAWRSTVLEIKSNEARMQGNDAVKKKLWAKALRLYTDAGRAAATSEEAQLAFVNRSFVNLQLARPEKALADAIKMNNEIPATEKARFREIRALYELRAFDRCSERLKEFIESFPENKEGKIGLKRVNTRLKEQNDGVYSFARIYQQAGQSLALVDCATFSRLVEVRETGDRGRGLYTTKAVRAGDILLCEKAFVYSYCDMTSGSYSMMMDLDTKRAYAGSQATTLSQAVQNLYHNPEYSRPFLQLHHGEYKPVSRDRADGSPVVDSFLAAKIISLNSFGAPRTSRDTLSKALKNEKASEDGKAGFGTSGIWVKASYVNHSCVGNCHRSFIGDMQILRATTDLEPRTELLFTYHSPEELESYKDMQGKLENWGFTCDCVLCLARRGISASLLSKRKTLMQNLQRTLSVQAKSLAKATKLLTEIKETYPSTYPAEAPRLEVQSCCFAIAVEYFKQNNTRKSATMFLEGLHALGYEVTAVWPSNSGNTHGAPTPKFEIKKWGVADNTVPWALVNLHNISRSIAPSISPQIFGYAKTAYAIVVGESESFLRTFPQAA